MDFNRFETFVINLDRSVDRWRQFEAAFTNSKLDNYCRISGFVGSAFPDIVAKLITNMHHNLIGKGQLGCDISHISIMERIDKEELPNSLILEDDIVPTGPIDNNFLSYHIPHDYDICFVNNRMIRGRLSEFGGERKVVPCLEAVAEFGPTDNAPGADGYFVSLNGARKLLKRFAHDGLGSFFDWRLIAYSVWQNEIDTLAKESTARAVLDILSRKDHWNDRLHSYVLVPPLIRNVASSSDILAENQKTL